MSTKSVSGKTELIKGLGPFSATCMVVGSMIGSGIFIVSADMASQVKSPGMLLLAWLVTGFVTIIAALSYGELAAAMPNAGGQYVYLREAFGPMWGYLYGWTLFFVIQTGTIAAVAVAFGKFLNGFFPQLTMDPRWHLFSIARWSVDVSQGQLAAIVALLVLGIANCYGIRWGAAIQNLTTVGKTIGLLGLILLAVFYSRGDWSHLTPMKPANTDVWSLGYLFIFGGAMVGSLFSSDAWNNVTFTSSEVKNPRRNLPLALGLGTTIVITLYLLANLGYLHVMSIQDITAFNESKRPQTLTLGVHVVSIVGGAVWGKLLIAAILVSVFGTMNGMSLAGARVYYAMARDGVFFKQLGRIHPRYHTPAFALIVQALWASILTLSGKYNELLDLVMFAIMVFYVMTVAGLFVLRRKRPDMERPYRAVGYPIVPAIYIVLAALISVAILHEKPYALPGLIITLVGVPFYFIWKWKKA
ncbi:MAG: amino acid permease [Acidobacteriia bacterium]|nr:amino acid permease [Terriglobia bacterium]